MSHQQRSVDEQNFLSREILQLKREKIARQTLLKLLQRIMSAAN